MLASLHCSRGHSAQYMLLWLDGVPPRCQQDPLPTSLHFLFLLYKVPIIIPIVQIKSDEPRDLSTLRTCAWSITSCGLRTAQGVWKYALSSSWSPIYCVALGGSCLLSGLVSIWERSEDVPPNSHTSAHLGLGVVEDTGRLPAEAGHHFLDGRGGAAKLLRQSSCLLPSPLRPDDNGGGERGAALKDKADSGPKV